MLLSLEVCFDPPFTVVLSQELSEQPKFSARQLASIVVSKVYFHLGKLNDAMSYALAAQNAFDLNAHDEFSHTIICISDLRILPLWS